MKPKFEHLKRGQQFIVTKGSNRFVRRVKYNPKDMRTFSKRICKDTIVTLTGLILSKREVHFDLGGEACIAQWGDFKRHTTPLQEGRMKRATINLCITSEDDDDIGDDINFSVEIVDLNDERARTALIFAARGAMNKLKKEGVRATGLCT
jgi:hypothetical protein